MNFGTAGNFAFYASSGTAASENPRLFETGGNTLNYSGAGGLDLTGGSPESGQVQLSGATSGTVTLSVRDAAGTYTFKLPPSAGAAGQVLTTDGAGNTSWGAGATTGVCTLSGGTCPVTLASVTAASRIFLTGQDNNVKGALRVSARTAGTGFTVTSSEAGWVRSAARSDRKELIPP